MDPLLHPDRPTQKERRRVSEDRTSGDGVFTQTNNGFRDLLDGSSCTAAFSESMLGRGIASTDAAPADPKREVFEVPGGNDTTPAACSSGAGAWSGKRGGKWLDGHYGNTLYNHYYAPNSAQWDCGNGSHNKGLSTARSYHSGGINLMLCDGSVRFVSNSVARGRPWRAEVVARSWAITKTVSYIIQCG